MELRLEGCLKSCNFVVLLSFKLPRLTSGLFFGFPLLLGLAAGVLAGVLLGLAAGVLLGLAAGVLLGLAAGIVCGLLFL